MSSGYEADNPSRNAAAPPPAPARAQGSTLTANPAKGRGAPSRKVAAAGLHIESREVESSSDSHEDPTSSQQRGSQVQSTSVAPARSNAQPAPQDSSSSPKGVRNQNQHPFGNDSANVPPIYEQQQQSLQIAPTKGPDATNPASAGSRKHPTAPSHHAGTTGTAAENNSQPVIQPPQAANDEQGASSEAIREPRTFASATKQLVYVRVKAASASSAYKFADTHELAIALLPEIAKTPGIADLFRDARITFSLHAHKHLPHSYRGFFYTAAFNISNPSDDTPNIPDILSKVEQITCSLPAILPAIGATSVKSKCAFAISREDLLGLTPIDFLVRVPPTVSISPAQDFALLLTQLYMHRGHSMTEAEYMDSTLADRLRFAKFCKPMKLTSTPYGKILDDTMHGTFLLDLENPISRDVAIMRFIIFGSLFGIDSRFGTHQQYVLHLPLLNDPLQLKHKPKIIQELLDEIKLNKEFMELKPTRTRKPRRDTSNSSCSESENEEAFQERVLHRADALRSLEAVPLHSDFLDYPSLHNATIIHVLDTSHKAPPQPPARVPAGVPAPNSDLRSVMHVPFNDIRAPLDLLTAKPSTPALSTDKQASTTKEICRNFQRGRCARDDCVYLHQKAAPVPHNSTNLQAQQQQQRMPAPTTAASAIAHGQSSVCASAAVQNASVTTAAPAPTGQQQQRMPAPRNIASATAQGQPSVRASAATQSSTTITATPASNASAPATIVAASRFTAPNVSQKVVALNSAAVQAPAFSRSPATASVLNAAYRTPEPTRTLQQNCDAATLAVLRRANLSIEAERSNSRDNSLLTRREASRLANGKNLSPPSLDATPPIIGRANSSSSAPAFSAVVQVSSSASIARAAELSQPTFPASAAPHSDSQEDAIPLLNDAGEPVIFNAGIAKSFPTLNQCSSAKIMSAAGEGDCLWHAVLGAVENFPVPIVPKLKANELRLVVLQYLKSNVRKAILPLAAFDNAQIYLNSPDASVAAQRSYRLVKDDKQNFLKLCSCPHRDEGTRHTCKGLEAGEIIVQGNDHRSFYSDFEQYFRIMSSQGAYSEELEIRGICSLYLVNIAVWCRKRDGFPEGIIQRYYNPRAKGLIVLYNHNGDGHYDWLSFANLEPPGATMTIDSPGPAPFSENPPSPTNETLIIQGPAAQKAALEESILHPAPFWLQIQKELALQTLSAHTLKFPFNWPHSSNGKHSDHLKFIDDALFIPCMSSHLHSCCNSYGHCLCCKEIECSWPENTDPWASADVPLSGFNRAAESLLMIASNLVQCTSVQLLSISSSYLFSRITVLLSNLLTRQIPRIDSFDQPTLDLLRVIAKKLADCPAILHSSARNLNSQFQEQFDVQSKSICDLAALLVGLVELAFSTLLVTPTLTPDHVVVDGTQPSTQPSQSTQSTGDMPITYRGYTEYFQTFFGGLATEAGCAASLAQNRLSTVFADNSMIASLQLDKLLANISIYHDSCTNYLASLKTIRRFKDTAFAETIAELAKRMAVSLETISNSRSTAQGCKAPLPNSAPKTPKKTASSKPILPILSPRQMHQQRTVLGFVERTSKTAESLRVIAEGSAIFEVSERTIRSLDQAEVEDVHQQEILEENMTAQREIHGSTVCRFAAEAHNRDQTGNADSQRSDNFSEERASDRDFVADSQPSQDIDHRHPGYAQARADINIAGQLSGAPDVISMKTVHDLPPGFCSFGHRIHKKPVIKRNKTLVCSYCGKSDLDEIYSCILNDAYSCISCLAGGKTHAPPPRCPSLTCATGSCTRQFFATKTTCFNHCCIAANQHFWRCTASNCKTKLCTKCAPLTVAPPRNSTSNERPSSSSSCSQEPKSQKRPAVAMRATPGQ